MDIIQTLALVAGAILVFSAVVYVALKPVPERTEGKRKQKGRTTIIFRPEHHFHSDGDSNDDKNNSSFDSDCDD